MSKMLPSSLVLIAAVCVNLISSQQVRPLPSKVDIESQFAANDDFVSTYRSNHQHPVRAVEFDPDDGISAAPGHATPADHLHVPHQPN